MAGSMPVTDSRFQELEAARRIKHHPCFHLCRRVGKGTRGHGRAKGGTRDWCSIPCARHAGTRVALLTSPLHRTSSAGSRCSRCTMDGDDCGMQWTQCMHSTHPTPWNPPRKQNAKRTGSETGVGPDHVDGHPVGICKNVQGEDECIQHTHPIRPARPELARIQLERQDLVYLRDDSNTEELGSGEVR